MAFLKLETPPPITTITMTEMLEELDVRGKINQKALVLIKVGRYVIFTGFLTTLYNCYIAFQLYPAPFWAAIFILELWCFASLLGYERIRKGQHYLQQAQQLDTTLPPHEQLKAAGNVETEMGKTRLLLVFFVLMGVAMMADGGVRWILDTASWVTVEGLFGMVGTGISAVGFAHLGSPALKNGKKSADDSRA